MKNKTDILSIYGAHRVLKPAFALPQSALKIDNTPRLAHPHELLLDVDFLMLDATSMRNIMESSANNLARAASRIRNIINSRGKMHNPVTNSGGVLVGKIREVGSKFFEIHPPLKGGNSTGQTIIPVASLSTLPLHIKRVKNITGDCVAAEGTAVMFSCMRICPVPEDFGPKLSLACVDISSLAPQVKRCLTKLAKNRRGTIYILILGCGKAGLAAMYTIRELEKTLRKKNPTRPKIKILAVDFNRAQVDFVKSLRIADVILRADAHNARELYAFVKTNTKEALCDFVINVVTVPGTETATVLCTRERNPHGIIFWFSMATRFDQAALATDSLGKDVTMLIGNGVADVQIEETFSLVRTYPQLRNYFEKH